MDAAIVTAADASYFDLLQDCISSIRRHPRATSLDLCVLDVGLSEQQVETIRPQVTHVRSPGWDIEFAAQASCPPWFRAFVSRPFLPKHFPEYELLIWLDADTWLCNWDAIDLLQAAGERSGFVAVPELDRSYSHCFHLRPGVLRNLRETYEQGFGREVAERLAVLPVINSGVLAIRRDSSAWSAWVTILQQALARSTRFLVEQCALNVAIYTGQIKPHFLPSWCNWNCAHATPLLNPATGELHSPMMPYERISICHLTDVKRQAVDVTGTDGAVRHIPLTY